MDDADVGLSAVVEGKDDDNASAEDGMVIGDEWKWRVVELWLLIASSCEAE